MSVVNTSEQPLGEIAISLSGGGYRAATFHLGVIDFLDRVGLLKDVRVLSTVSGGTFTGMMYVVSRQENTSFEGFYNKLYTFLRDTHVIDLALKDLANKDANDKSMPSLIKRAAQVYAGDNMLGDRRLGPLIDYAAANFRGLIFNAVEFRNGLSFRFQTSETGRAFVGNQHLRIKKEVARKIRLADIAAASSCFPSAFEPLRFPDDFNWPANDTVAGVRQALGEGFEEPLPLMDGGIYDNQGIDSVVQVYKREDDDLIDDIGLFIISDTSQRRDNIFDFPSRERTGWLSLRGATRVAWLLFILALIASLSLLVNFVVDLRMHTLGLWKAIFLYIIPLIFSFAIVIALYWGRGRLLDALATIQEKTRLELWSKVNRLTIPELLQLIDGRLKSLIALSSSVFMKRVRDLGYKDISVYEKYNGHLCRNLIYDLDNDRFGAAMKARGIVPSQKLRTLAREAEAVPTNLWSTGEETLQKLIACGHATICFSLMKYIVEDREQDLADPASAVSKLFTQLQQIWQLLQEEPHKLIRPRPPRESGP